MRGKRQLPHSKHATSEPFLENNIDHRFDEEKDPLGARMKECYENQTRTYLPEKTYSLVRLDGRSFHVYTRGLERPYDSGLLKAMGETMSYLCHEVSNCRLGYCQSDEISLLLVDFLDQKTQAFFGGNVQKIASVCASMATAYFNSIYQHPLRPRMLATFDARVFTIPTQIEASNYFLWRQKDAKRNAVSMIGQAHLSPRELHGLSTREITERLEKSGISLSSFPETFLSGQIVERVSVLKPVEYTNKRTGEVVRTEPVERHEWQVGAAPEFKGLEWLLERVPEKPEQNN